MESAQPPRSPALDWLTVVAIAAIAISLNVAFHEGIHALACVLVGGDLQEYSALHVSCEHGAAAASKIVSGSASLANLLLGTLCWLMLPRVRGQSSELQFFVWLFMLMNWLYGAGYWMLSGAFNIGDWAGVIAGLEPHWLWRGLMLLAGSGLFIFFVWLALRELGKIIGGAAQEQIGRAARLGLWAYLASALTIIAAGIFNPYGILGLPAVAGISAALGALSPLLWMMQWLRAGQFVKPAGPPLEIQRNWRLVAFAGLTLFLYAFILGRSVYF